MAAKATIVDVTDAGFRPEQFGTPDDWETPGTGYIVRVLDRAEAWARGRMGAAAYDGLTAVSDPQKFEQVRAAELCFVRAELWKRRASYIDSNAASALENLAYLDRREFEAQAERAWECALDWMGQAAGDADELPGSAAVLAHAETGPFAGGFAYRGRSPA